jgi:endonuclease/exonuclease/phosphatase family metal-dependent hydrolase
MTFNILHLNIERNNHIETLKKLIKESNPHIICLAEAMNKDIKKIANDFGYQFAFAPLILLKDGNNTDQEGSAILSKYPILEVNKYRYDDQISDITPLVLIEDLISKNGERPSNRFKYNYTLLTASIKINENQKIIVSTTHFPVTDHNSPGYKNHEMKNFLNIDDIEHSNVCMDRLIHIIRSLDGPIIFTADLNNPRGEYIYDLLAHELIDIVPNSLKSSIDPKLHRVKNLQLLVDTIMVSSDFKTESFKVIEGVSDHKAYFATLNII